MSSIVPLYKFGPIESCCGRCASLDLEQLEADEQFVLWVLRHWISGTSRWSRLWAGVQAYLGNDDSVSALRAFGDVMLCIKYNGRRPFHAGAPGCAVTPDELAVLSLVSSQQHHIDPLTDGLTKWLVMPASQEILKYSAAQFADILVRHKLVLRDRCAETEPELLVAI